MVLRVPYLATCCNTPAILQTPLGLHPSVDCNLSASPCAGRTRGGRARTKTGLNQAVHRGTNPESCNAVRGDGPTMLTNVATTVETLRRAGATPTVAQKVVIVNGSSQI